MKKNFRSFKFGFFSKKKYILFEKITTQNFFFLVDGRRGGGRGGHLQHLWWDQTAATGDLSTPTFAVPYNFVIILMNIITALWCETWCPVLIDLQHYSTPRCSGSKLCNPEDPFRTVVEDLSFEQTSLRLYPCRRMPSIYVLQKSIYTLRHQATYTRLFSLELHSSRFSRSAVNSMTTHNLEILNALINEHKIIITDHTK